jgi:glutamate synthase (NADPH/NADH) small chain
MGEAKGFLKYTRQDVPHRPFEECVLDFRECAVPLSTDTLREQAARCMDCGVPFCHAAGCPVGNVIPDVNDLVYRGDWEEACHLLHATNNFPEVTGRICPAPCESACTLSINDRPVTIQHIELQVAERGFEQGWIRPLPAREKMGTSVAVIGSGPAGLAAGQQLARAGHDVVVFEVDERVGGMLRYGIPEFKLEKRILDRRLYQLTAEGVRFETGVEVGADLSVRYLRRTFDAVCLAVGARQPRDLAVPGADRDNVLSALDYLSTQNRLCTGESIEGSSPVSAEGKDVVVLGGGDTGSDCVGTARRQGAKRITQLEILPRPPATRPPSVPWPRWPRLYKESAAHALGCEQRWNVTTTEFAGNDRVEQVHAREVEWSHANGDWQMHELPGSDFVLDADLVILALGFVHTVHDGLVHDLGVEVDKRGNVRTTGFQTSIPWVFAAGDAVTGASWVASAIHAGREAATAIDRWLRQ